MNIVVLAAKERVRLDMQLDIGIARRPTAEAWHSLSFQPQHLLVLGTLGDRHLQRLAFRQRDCAYGTVCYFQKSDRKHIVYILAARSERALGPTSPARKCARKKLF